MVPQALATLLWRLYIARIDDHLFNINTAFYIVEYFFGFVELFFGFVEYLFGL